MKTQHWSAPEYAKHAHFVSSMASEVLSLLNPQQGEVVLDLGCGDGELGAYIQSQGCSVIGIDASASMVAAAKARGLTALEIDGHNMDFENQFDAVFSNAALHWLLQPEKVIDGVRRALKEKGRFVAEMGGVGNIATLVSAMEEVFTENPGFGEFQNPWYFPSVDKYQSLLEKAGFLVKDIALTSRPTPLTGGLDKWLDIFANSIHRQLSDEQKIRFFNAVERKVKSALFSEQEGWVADYVRLRFKAIKL